MMMMMYNEVVMLGSPSASIVLFHCFPALAVFKFLHVLQSFLCRWADNNYFFNREFHYTDWKLSVFVGVSVMKTKVVQIIAAIRFVILHAQTCQKP